MKKVFGNVPTIPFILFLLLAACLVVLSLPMDKISDITGAALIPPITEISKPDLIIKTVYLDAGIAFARVENIGTASTIVPFKLSVTWSQTTTCPSQPMFYSSGTSGSSKGSESVSKELTPDLSYAVNYICTWIFDVSALGANDEITINLKSSFDGKEITVKADSTNAIAESSETNNAWIGMPTMENACTQAGGTCYTGYECPLGIAKAQTVDCEVMGQTCCGANTCTQAGGQCKYGCAVGESSILEDCPTVGQECCIAAPCSGTLSFSLYPSTTTPDSAVTASVKVSKIGSSTNCAGKRVDVYLGYPLEGTYKCNCILGSETTITNGALTYETSCSCNFNAPAEEDNYTYSANVEDLSQTALLTVETASTCPIIGGTCRVSCLYGESFLPGTCLPGQECCGIPTDTCTPAGGGRYCAYECNVTAGETQDATKTCPTVGAKCCVPATVSKIILQVPSNNSIHYVPTSITFNWTPKNFVNATPACMAGYLDIINVPDQNWSKAIWSNLILCNNNQACSWTPAVFDIASNYEWVVGCWDDPNNNDDYIISDVWFFETKSEAPLKAAVDLILPSQDATLAPGKLNFIWKPKDFVNVTVPCFPYAWENGTYPNETGIFPVDDYNNATFIYCENNKNCNWTTAIDWPAFYLWQVICADFNITTGNYTYIFSDEGHFKIRTGVACTENWIPITDWVPATCPPTGIQAKKFKEVNKCGTANAMPQGCELIPDTVPFECTVTRSCGYLPTGLEQLTPWAPYPCDPEGEQSALFRYPNGTILNQSRPCCLENWTTDWQECDPETGLKEGIWIDTEECDTTYTKPAEAPEPQACIVPAITWQKLMIWILIAAIAIVVIIAAALYAIKRARTRAARVVKEAAKPVAKPAAAAAAPAGAPATLPEKEVKHPALQDYIKKARARGMTKETIRKELLKSGWPEDIIDKVLAA